jgi:cell wall-associated NlpC family hydrolase
MSEPETRAAIVAEAMTWAGTPYHHRARVKGVGADCAQFPAAVYEAVGLIPPVAPTYPHDWHMHRDAEIYLDWIAALGARPIEPGAEQAGDFAVWRFGRTFSHGGIILARGRVIHAYVGVGVSVDDYDQHEELRTRPRRFFTVFGGDAR